MATPLPAPYQPTSDDDARLRLAQIVGSDLDINIWTGDWHDAIRDIAAHYAPQHAADQQPPYEAAA
ncbi:hypothetical protein [Streptomyces sp. NPDC018584]|uniref:hypothetical protein n=1 Tax=unclassified Streptomyces TaxID=2593676 RepID=UPI0037BB0937